MPLKLRRDDDTPDSLPFPAGGVECIRSPLRKVAVTADPPDDAVRNVERAMHDAQLKFDRLRRMLGLDDDRPRAA